MFQLVMIESDQTVGNPDATVTREYRLKTVDTLPHALRLQSEYEDRLRASHRIEGYAYGMNHNKAFHEVIVDKGHPYEYGHVYRYSYVTIASVAR